MDISCRCRACEVSFKLDASFAGKSARCPGCGELVPVPLLTAESAERQPRWRDDDPPLPETAAAASATDDPLAGFAISPTPSKRKRTAAAVPGRRKSPAWIPVAVVSSAVAIGIVAIVVIGIVAFRSQPPAGDGKSVTVAADPSRGTLVLDWPESDRPQAATMIDGNPELTPASGPVKYALPPGKHRLLLRRHGYEPIEHSVVIAAGKEARFKPRWKELAVAAVPSINTASTLSPAGASETAFSGPDPSSLAPRGFEGWYQLVAQAAARARAQKKDILIVFGSSDSSEDTQKLSAALAAADAKAAIEGAFVPVIVDFPLTVEAFNLLEDRGQNEDLKRQYGVSHVPIVVLTDETGLPYFRQDDFASGFSGLAETLVKARPQRAERDKLLAATAEGDESARLEAATKALSWLQERRLVPLFEEEMQDWLNLAARLDAANERGRLEPFLQADLEIRLSGIDAEDEREVEDALSPLAPFVSERRFASADRGATLHLLAAQLLQGIGRRDACYEHLARAISYEPEDAELKQAVARARSFLETKNVLSTGTGFVVSSAGYLLTNEHVVAGKGKTVVRVGDSKETVPAEIVARDEERDIALLKINVPTGVTLTQLALSPSPVSRGAAVGAFGYPLGDSVGSGLKLTTGIISAVADPIEDNTLLLDVRINPGNSGGPLCNSRGHVIGMVTAKTGGGFFEAIDSYGMALPAPELLDFLQKHLPGDSPRLEAEGNEALSWDQVDQRVSPGVLMILKLDE